MQNELSFSKTTKTVIDKDLLLNIKKVSELTLQMQETIDQYKNYWKLDLIETQLCKLNILLHDSFNKAFAQIVDLSLKESDSHHESSVESVGSSGQNKVTFDIVNHPYRHL